MLSLIHITMLQWIRSPGRVALFLYPALILVVAMILQTLYASEVSGVSEIPEGWSGVSIYYMLVFGVGIISREREDGVLAGVFARPIYRSTYVFAKWLALALAAYIGTLLFIILQSAFVLSCTHHLDLVQLLRVIIESGFVCLGLAATMVAFSTVAPTYGDIYLYGMAWFGLMMLTSLAELFSTIQETSPILKHLDLDYLIYLQHMLTIFLLPNMDLLAPPHLWIGMVLAYTSNILGALLISIFWINRKELSYGG